MLERRSCASCPQAPEQPRDATRLFFARHVARQVALTERGGEVAEWAAAGLGDANTPLFAVVDEEAGRKRRGRAGANQRRFAATGATYDGKQPVLLKLHQDIVNLPSTTEKQVALAAQKRTEPDKRVRRLLHGGPPLRGRTGGRATLRDRILPVLSMNLIAIEMGGSNRHASLGLL